VQEAGPSQRVERHNRTIRTLMKRFTRLSLGFSKKLENLEEACAMFLALYNFV
jgi:IS1 family transposase